MSARIHTHVHQPDGVKVSPLSDEEGCTACPMPGGHPCHTLPDVPEQAEHRRRIGETEGEQ